MTTWSRRHRHGMGAASIPRWRCHIVICRHRLVWMVSFTSMYSIHNDKLKSTLSSSWSSPSANEPFQSFHRQHYLPASASVPPFSDKRRSLSVKNLWLLVHSGQWQKNQLARMKKSLVRIFTGRNEVLAKVIFLHVCVILFTGGGLLQISGGVPAPNFRGGVPAPNFRGGCLLQIFGGGACSKFLGGVSNLRNTVNVQPVRILLECILVKFMYLSIFICNVIVWIYLRLIYY